MIDGRRGACSRTCLPMHSIDAHKQRQGPAMLRRGQKVIDDVLGRGPHRQSKGSFGTDRADMPESGTEQFGEAHDAVKGVRSRGR